MPGLTHSDVAALEGWDARTPILVVSGGALLGLCWLISRMTPLPLGDLLFVLAVSGYAAFEMNRSSKAESLSLPSPVGAGRGEANESFSGFVRQRHELLCLLTKQDKRVRAMALGVGGLVMLLWRLFGAQMFSASNSQGDAGIGVEQGKFQLQGWVVTLTASKLTKFLTRRTMVAIVRRSRGAAWVPMQVVVLLFCGSICGLITHCVEPGQRLVVFRHWAAQWLFAISFVEAAWCYIRWQLWRRLARRLKWWSPSKGVTDKAL